MSDFFEGFKFIFRGGFMMIPLLASSLLALTVIVERWKAFHKRYLTPPDFTQGVLAKVQEGKTAEALRLCNGKPIPVAAVLKAGLEHFKNPTAEMEIAMKNEGESWIPVLEKRVHVLDTTITIAPLMGLLGTIIGMMGSFKVLTQSGVDDPYSITGGIAEALIATATGLVVALVCVVAHNYFNTRIKNFIYEMESAASRLLEARMASERRKN
ncbi:MAG TPA: MotA/TolQ/ExbB proton channel family protein [bacterium]|jgi:biopolymer transport protein ExbB|nr:MotA/TolQ/ExbB proton channel family protein [bacterium]